LRRFWWRGTQRRRLAVAGTGALLSLAGTCLVLLGGGQAPSPPALAARLPPSATPTLADPAVAVCAVSAVEVRRAGDLTAGLAVRLYGSIGVVGRIRSTTVTEDHVDIGFEGGTTLRWAADHRVQVVELLDLTRTRWPDRPSRRNRW
jgi:hypothetical protein